MCKKKEISFKVVDVVAQSPLLDVNNLTIYVSIKFSTLAYGDATDNNVSLSQYTQTHINTHTVVSIVTSFWASPLTPSARVANGSPALCLVIRRLPPGHL